MKLKRKNNLVRENYEKKFSSPLHTVPLIFWVAQWYLASDIKSFLRAVGGPKHATSEHPCVKLQILIQQKTCAGHLLSEIYGQWRSIYPSSALIDDLLETSRASLPKATQFHWLLPQKIGFNHKPVRKIALTGDEACFQFHLTVNGVKSSGIRKLVVGGSRKVEKMMGRFEGKWRGEVERGKMTRWSGGI